MGCFAFRDNLRNKAKTTNISDDRKYLTLTDGFKAGKFKLIGGIDLHFYQLEQIYRIRIIKRADGYYAQLCINTKSGFNTPNRAAIRFHAGRDVPAEHLERREKKRGLLF